jgi:PAS domain S-box-containing protein
MHASKDQNDQSVIQRTSPSLDALRASEARYRALAAASADVIYRMSPDWSEMRALEGDWSPSDTVEPTGTWLSRFILPEDRLHVTAVIDHAVRSKTTFELEHRVVRADGTPGWTFSRAVPVLGADGGIVEWIGSATDVTERKRAEHHLRDSEERFRSVADSGVLAICVFDETGVILEANDAYRDLFRATREQLASGALTTFTITAPSSIERAQLALDEYRRTGVITPYEKEYVRSDGTRFWALVSGRRMINGQGVGFVVDIDERKRTEQRQAIVADISRELVGSLDVATMMRRLCETIGRHFGAKRCAFAEVGAGAPDAVVAHQWSDADVAPLAPSYRWLDYASPESIAAHAAGEPDCARRFPTKPSSDAHASLSQPSASAKRTSPARLVRPSRAMPLARCVSTVFTLIESDDAISLLL